MSQAEAEIVVAVLKEAGGIVFDEQTGRYVLYDINAEISITWDEQADTVFGQMVAMYMQAARDREATATAAKVHGNSKQSKRPQHMYEIFRFNRDNPAKQEVVKTGISGTQLVPLPNLRGLADTSSLSLNQWTSLRASTQVRAFDRLEPPDSNIVHGYRIVKMGIPDRATALELEERNTQSLVESGHRLVHQKRPWPGQFELPPEELQIRVRD
ncbi:MAG: hypothetical protein FWE02_00480 [Defluviitaleaceae bacterium]|nr:hypothetical protein [Defluviitaleaceae bacterium]